jgi:hypothetical protein
MARCVHLIYLFAFYVVLTCTWNNESKLPDYCGIDNVLFDCHVLSISDETLFVLVALINDTER